jgi:hypothetical protein
VTPGAYIALARDIIVLIALGALIWLLVSYGKDVVKVADMKAVQQQIVANAKTEQSWRETQTNANLKHDSDLATVRAAIGAQRAPVIVRSGPPRACPVPVNSAQAGSPPAPAGGTDPGPGVDSRPLINAFELKYETALADARKCLDSWPQ